MAALAVAHNRTTVRRYAVTLRCLPLARYSLFAVILDRQRCGPEERGLPKAW